MGAAYSILLVGEQTPRVAQRLEERLYGGKVLSEQEPTTTEASACTTVSNADVFYTSQQDIIPLRRVRSQTSEFFRAWSSPVRFQCLRVLMYLDPDASQRVYRRVVSPPRREDARDLHSVSRMVDESPKK